MSAAKYIGMFKDSIWYDSSPRVFCETGWFSLTVSCELLLQLKILQERVLLPHWKSGSKLYTAVPYLKYETSVVGKELSDVLNLYNWH